MLQTLSFKQGLADFVLDAMGDAADFERQNLDEKKDKKKESAFMQRLASVMGDAVKVKPEPQPRSEPKIPPEERLRAEMAAECPGVERLVMGLAGEGGERGVRGAVVVGSGIDRAEAARRIAGTHGVALPDSAVEVVTPETWRLLDRLRDMGIISFCSGNAKEVFVRDAPDAAKAEAARRRKAAEKSDAELDRLLSMGELLVNGGFDAEGQIALRKAVALAAGAARFALGKVPEEAGVAPVSTEELVAARGELDLRPELALVLQLAVQGLDIPRPVESARAYVEDCRAMWR